MTFTHTLFVSLYRVHVPLSGTSDRFNLGTMTIYLNQSMTRMAFYWQAGVCARQRIGKCKTPWSKLDCIRSNY